MPRHYRTKKCRSGKQYKTQMSMRQFLIYPDLHLYYPNLLLYWRARFPICINIVLGFSGCLLSVPRCCFILPRMHFYYMLIYCYSAVCVDIIIQIYKYNKKKKPSPRRGEEDYYSFQKVSAGRPQARTAIEFVQYYRPCTR